MLKRALCALPDILSASIVLRHFSAAAKCLFTPITSVPRSEAVTDELGTFHTLSSSPCPLLLQATTEARHVLLNPFVMAGS